MRTQEENEDDAEGLDALLASASIEGNASGATACGHLTRSVAPPPAPVAVAAPSPSKPDGEGSGLDVNRPTVLLGEDAEASLAGSSRLHSRVKVLLENARALDGSV